MSKTNDTHILELALTTIYSRINEAVADGFSKKSVAALRQCLPSNYEQSFSYKPPAVAEKPSLEQQLEKVQDTFKGTFLSGHFSICENSLYFRYDTGDLTAKENEEDFHDMREMMEKAGYEVVEPLCEHDCITCTLVDKNAAQ